MLRNLLLATVAAPIAAGCDRFQDTPLQEAPPAASAPSNPSPTDDLATGYAAAIATLPEFTADQGSSWSGLTLGPSGVGTRRSETSRSVEEISTQLDALQETVETIRLLGEQEATLPDCATSKDTSVDGGAQACRVARDAARLLHSDAIRMFARGDTEGAAKRIAAGLGIVRQLSKADEAASMNALAVFTLITDPLRPMTEGVAGHKLDALDQGIVRSALERLDADAPFGLTLPAELAQEAADTLAATRRLLTSG